MTPGQGPGQGPAPAYPPPPPPPTYQPPAYPPPGGPHYTYGAPVPADAFGRPLAGWWPRVGALFIDGLIVGIPSAIVAGILAASTNRVDPTTGLRTVGSGRALVWLIPIVAQLLYFALLDGQTQTVGKRALKIAVRDHRTGQPIGFGRALGRWLIYVVLWYALFIPGALNALSPLWDSRRQAWHDHAVGSVVVQV